MFDTYSIFEELSVAIGETPAKAITKALANIHSELINSVTKVEFNDLKKIVAELAEAQKRTEEKVNQLAEAQKRTEEKVNQLAEAQKRTEEKVNQLAEAQKKTEETLTKLIKRVDRIEEQVGGLSMAVGYGIEDKLYPHINRFVQKVFSASPQITILRKHLENTDGQYIEINLFTEAKLDGEDVLIIGECKAQPGKKDVDRFIKLCEIVQKLKNKGVRSYIIGYTFRPEVERYIQKNYPEIKIYRTYEVEYAQY